MITSAKIQVANAIERSASGSGGVSLELVLLLGIAAAIIVTLVYLFTRKKRSSS